MSSMNMSLQNLLKQLSGSRDKANKANEERYNDILGRYEKGRNVANNQLNAAGEVFARNIRDTEARLDTAGRSALRDVDRNRAERLAAGRGDIADRGFGTSATLNASMRRREDEMAGRQREDINERVSTQKAGILSGLTGDLGNFMFNRTGMQQGLLGNQLNFMERRTDTADGSMLDFLNQLGIGGGAAGSGGGGFQYLGGGGAGYAPGQTISRRRYI